MSSSPISLWNTALEVHTGRIFEPALGPFYILVVPLAGLAMLVILVSGLMAWWLARRKKAQLATEALAPSQHAGKYVTLQQNKIS